VRAGIISKRAIGIFIKKKPLGPLKLGGTQKNTRLHSICETLLKHKDNETGALVNKDMTFSAVT